MDGFIGEIRIFGGNYAPEGWVFCNGQLLPISQNTALFSLLGTAYGGDGTSTFGVPDLRSRLTVGVGQGQGNGVTQNYPWPSTGGVPAVTLSEATMPAHTHAEQAVTVPNAGTSASPAGNLYAGVTGGGEGYYANPPSNFNADPNMLTSEGGNQAHANVMPVLGLSYIIATAGNYPQFPT